MKLAERRSKLPRPAWPCQQRVSVYTFPNKYTSSNRKGKSTKFLLRHPVDITVSRHTLVNLRKEWDEWAHTFAICRSDDRKTYRFHPETRFPAFKSKLSQQFPTNIQDNLAVNDCSRLKMVDSLTPRYFITGSSKIQLTYGLFNVGLVLSLRLRSQESHGATSPPGYILECGHFRVESTLNGQVISYTFQMDWLGSLAYQITAAWCFMRRKALPTL